MQYVVEVDESCGIARGVEYGGEAIFHDVPRWRSRMDVITAETNQIDEEESCRKLHTEAALSSDK